MQSQQQPEDAFVPPGAEFAWEAFWRLHSSRQMIPLIFTSKVIEAGMGGVAITHSETKPRRIPFAAVDRYAHRYGIAGAAFDLFLALIEKLDDAYVTWEGEKLRDRIAAVRG